MSHTWFVIDRDGRRAVRGNPMDFWSKFNYSGDDSEWPEFTQFVVSLKDVKLADIHQAIETVARTRGLECHDVSSAPEQWGEALVVAKNGEALCLTEPRVDLEDRFLDDEVAEQLAGLLASDAVFFGHAPGRGTIHVTTFETGACSLAWYDSSLPGPSFARIFHRNGQCTDEDPRSYALRVMDMPETSPLLDRYAFVASRVEPFGVETISPELDDCEIERAYEFLKRVGPQ